MLSSFRLGTMFRGGGATVVKAAQDTVWGGYAGYFKDLDGHLLEAVYNPKLLPDEG